MVQDQWPLSRWSEYTSTQDIKLDGPSEIYKHLRTIEMEKKRRPMVDYMEKIQNDNINSNMRGILVDWKYGEINPPHVEEFCFITDNTYNKADVSMMESDILKTLDFEMSNPTVKTFLRRFNGISCENKDAQSLQFEFLTYYLAELSLLGYVCLRWFRCKYKWFVVDASCS